ncbi:MAG: putative peptidoglycan glycosyltransferase FtsW [Planctomycetota bacterium]
MRLTVERDRQDALRGSAEALLWIALSLYAVGAVALFSVRGASRSTGEFLIDWGPLRSRLIEVAVGLSIALVFSRVSFDWLRTHRRWMLGGTAITLFMVFIPPFSVHSHGARRWLDLGPLGFQPSEIAKIVLVLYTADFLTRHQDRLTDFRRGFLPPNLVVGFFALLILFEPDFGTALFVFGSCSMLLLIGGVPWKHLAAVVLGAAPLVILVAVQRFDHIARRFNIFLNLRADYQMDRSLIALGSGGLKGVGLGASREKLGYLPESANDFVFAAWGEEAGFLGALGVLILFGLFLWFGGRLVLSLRDRFAFLFCAGLVIQIAGQAAVNIAVVTGTVPPKGIPLPFVSAGGSSLLATSMCVGLLWAAVRSELSEGAEGGLQRGWRQWLPGRRLVSRPS